MSTRDDNQAPFDWSPPIEYETERRAAPAAPMGQELPARAIKTWQDRTGNHNIRPGSVKHMIAEITELRQAIAQRDERIRHLERELDQARGAYQGCARALDIANKAAEADGRGPVQSIDTPEFRELVEWWAGAAHSSDKYTRTVRAKTEWAKLIAYIDGRTAGTDQKSEVKNA